MQPIETKYKGYRFRSRLEARWAIFFDEMGIDYFYEYQGYKLPSGNYLPDFYLPKWDVYFEIKGKDPTKLELDLINELCVYTGKMSCIVYGEPDLYPKGLAFVYVKQIYDMHEDDIQEEIDRCELVMHSDTFVIRNYPDGDRSAWLIINNYDNYIFYKKKNNSDLFERYGERPVLNTEHDYDYNETAFEFDDDVVDAVKKAKEARFEHSETK